MRTLIHVCCAPCLLGPLGVLREQGMELQGLFYNPNIHPLLEFRRRVKALRVFLEADDLPVEMVEEYGLEQFVREVYHPVKRVRCSRCYFLRLHETAVRAREQGFDCFTTTLLGSPHQDHDLVREAGERAAAQVGVGFLYRDFRHLHHLAHQEARQRRLYLQPYCGCCFSEYERYRDTTRELYRGPGRRESPR